MSDETTTTHVQVNYVALHQLSEGLPHWVASGMVMQGLTTLSHFNEQDALVIAQQDMKQRQVGIGFRCPVCNSLLRKKYLNTSLTLFPRVQKAD